MPSISYKNSLAAIKNKNLPLAVQNIHTLAEANEVDESGMTVLHHACSAYEADGLNENQTLNLIVALLKAGGDFRVCNNNGKTPDQLIKKLTAEDKKEWLRLINEGVAKDNLYQPEKMFALNIQNEEEQPLLLDIQDIEADLPGYLILSRERKKLSDLVNQTKVIAEQEGISPLLAAVVLFIMWGVPAVLGAERLRLHFKPEITEIRPPYMAQEKTDGTIYDVIIFAAIWIPAVIIVTGILLQQTCRNVPVEDIHALLEQLHAMFSSFDVSNAEKNMATRVQHINENTQSLNQNCVSPTRRIQAIGKDIAAIQAWSNKTGLSVFAKPAAAQQPAPEQEGESLIVSNK